VNPEINLFKNSIKEITKMEQSKQPLLLKINEAAKLLTISSRTVWELTRRGKLRCIRIHRLVRYDTQDLLAYIEEQKKNYTYEI
jgi:excisionase family DNA binding protein